MTEHERYKAMKANKKTLNEFYRLSGINPINEDYDDSLTPEEQKILNDIISEMDTLNEADFGSVLKKLKSYAKKGVLTAGIMAALLATPGISNAQSEQIKSIANIEQSDTNNIDSVMTNLGMVEVTDADYSDYYVWDGSKEETYVEAYVNPENSDEYIIDAKVKGERIVKRFDVKDTDGIKNMTSKLISGSSKNYMNEDDESHYNKKEEYVLVGPSGYVSKELGMLDRKEVNDLSDGKYKAKTEDNYAIVPKTSVNPKYYMDEEAFVDDKGNLQGIEDPTRGRQFFDEEDEDAGIDYKGLFPLILQFAVKKFFNKYSSGEIPEATEFTSDQMDEWIEAINDTFTVNTVPTGVSAEITKRVIKYALEDLNSTPKDERQWVPVEEQVKFFNKVLTKLG